MKSLEIVNEQLEMLKHPIIYVEEWVNIRKLELIKQDLEVLEIIRKKEVEVHHLQYFLDVYDGVDGVVLDHYNSFINEERKLTLEELLKLKQWLEDNE